jgi:SAM-dependent methyltransferase
MTRRRGRELTEVIGRVRRLPRALRGEAAYANELAERDDQLRAMAAQLDDRTRELESLTSMRDGLEGAREEAGQLLSAIELLSERHSYLVDLPSEELRLHVGRNTSAANFLLHGLLSSRRVLEMFGEEPSGLILDWGCGSGRTLRWLLGYPAWRASYRGCDVDEGAIAWLKSVTNAEVAVCGDEPPLPYPDETLTGLFAFSVLTHIHPTAHRRWYGEIARVLAPGGRAYLTTQGRTIVDDQSKRVPAGPREEFRRDGWTFVEHSGHYKGASLVSEDFTRQALEDRLRLLEYTEAGYGNMDAFLVAKTG